MSEDRNVVAVDLDGTLAVLEPSDDPYHIGPPVPAMVDRVRDWLDDGVEVWIFTSSINGPDVDRDEKIARIHDWLEQQDLPALNVTDVKEHFFKEYWDDRAVQVVENTGHPVDGRDHHG